MTEYFTRFHDHEEAFREGDGKDTALGVDLFLWQVRQEHQKPISFPQLVCRWSSKNRQMLLSTLGTIGGFAIIAATGALTDVRLGLNPTLQQTVFAFGNSCEFLWITKSWFDGMNG